MCLNVLVNFELRIEACEGYVFTGICHSVTILVAGAGLGVRRYASYWNANQRFPTGKNQIFPTGCADNSGLISKIHVMPAHWRYKKLSQESIAVGCVPPAWEAIPASDLVATNRCRLGEGVVNLNNRTSV